MKHMILRTVSRSSGSRVRVTALTARDHDVTLEVNDLEERQVLDAKTDDSVLAIAPAMPIVTPPLPPSISSSSLPDDGDGATWGITAMGVDKSERTGKGVTVAVLDTGICDGFENHESFSRMAGQTIIENFTSEEDASDTDGHGTHCAGTIFGDSLEGRRIGVAPNVSKRLIAKVLGTGGGTTESIVEAIQWATSKHKAHIVSMSLGMDFPGMAKGLVAQGYPEDLATSIALSGYTDNVRLFDKLSAWLLSKDVLGEGTLLVAAAGNESRRDLHERYGIRVAPPAASDGVLSVAAVGRVADPETKSCSGHPPGDYCVAWFSNTSAEVGAPGVSILSAGINGELESLSGTSMATPHVAGVAALWAEKMQRENGWIKAEDVKARLRGNAVPFPCRRKDDVGTGFVVAPPH